MITEPETQIEIDIVSETNPTYTFTWAPTKDVYPNWITCPRNFNSIAEAAEGAMEWMLHAFETGMPVQVNLKKIGGSDYE
jgi:hypothetical protein